MPHLDRLRESFPDVPPMVLLKAELLRGGIRLGVDPSGAAGEPVVVAPGASLHGSLELPGGLHVFVSPNPASPYVLFGSGRTRALTLGYVDKRRIEPLAEVKPGPRFRWTTARTSRGTPIATMFAPSLGGACGPLAVCLLRDCEYAAAGEECRFCGSARAPAVSDTLPDVDDMREAITAIRSEQHTVSYLAFGGGSLFDRSREADVFVQYLSAVRATGARLPATVAAIQALDRVDSWRLRNAGFDYACHSMDVWDRRLWREVLPGKNRVVGREKWMSCLASAVEVFGPGRVLCNFIAGVETAATLAYASPAEAAAATLDGMRWCYERGVYPKYTAWTAVPGSRYGEKPPAPLEYFVRLMVGRQQLYREYDMRVPATECQRCLTQSFEADLARLDPARYGAGAAGVHQWHKAHPPAAWLN